MLKIKKFFFSNQRQKINPIILMIGAPGVGKGTYSKLISREFKIKEFSTGDELRHISSSTNISPEMKEIKEILSQGNKLID